jgi:hypothetical protein
MPDAVIVDFREFLSIRPTWLAVLGAASGRNSRLLQAQLNEPLMATA